VVHCDACGYGANIEKATRGPWGALSGEVLEVARKVPTPGKKTIEEVTDFLGIPAQKLVKTLLYNSENGLVAALVRGDREVNEVKLQNKLPNTMHLELASPERVAASLGLPLGYVGPEGLRNRGVLVLADLSVQGLLNFAYGANEAGHHVVGANWDQSNAPAEFDDLVLVAEGDPCPSCGAPLRLSRGIEVGHIFKLGTKYSETLKCDFTDEAGAVHPMIMGCYGLGIGRTVAAAIEQNHDADGIIWPLPLAPFEVLVVALNVQDAATRETAEKLAAELSAAGLDVLYDDRDERPGVKFKDADLVGIPVRVVVGGKSLAAGQIELSLRRDPRTKIPVPVAEAAAKARELAAGLR
jgi:prolyl-tRNA synthetase